MMAHHSFIGEFVHRETQMKTVLIVEDDPVNARVFF
jgi:hypothetical protein